jgi:hypothetical protein
MEEGARMSQTLHELRDSDNIDPTSAIRSLRRSFAGTILTAMMHNETMVEMFKDIVERIILRRIIFKWYGKR